MDQETKKLLDVLRTDLTQGASDLACLGLETIKNYIAETPFKDVKTALCGICRLARRVSNLRPSMAPVFSSALLVEESARLLAEKENCVPVYLGKLKKTIGVIERRLRSARDQAARNALLLLKNRHHVLTHSRSATILRVFEMLPRRDVHIVATESRPGGEGIQTVEALLKMGYRITLIPDTAAGMFIAGVDMVLVGGDAVLKDGSLVNKSGTYLLALAAHASGVPFYAVVDTFKFVPREDISLEEKDSREIAALDHPGLEIRNLYFDRTPSPLITGIITEKRKQARKSISD